MGKDLLRMIRRLRGRCYYCGAKIKREAITCKPCAPLLDKDPEVSEA